MITRTRPRRFRAQCATTLLLATLAACVGAPRVSTDYDAGYDFAAIVDYHLVEHDVSTDPSGMGNTLADQRIARVIADEMAQRGLPAVSAEDADILVNFYIVTADRTQVTAYNDGYGYRRYGSGYGRGGTYAERQRVDVWNYTEGTLILDLVDPAEQRIVWRGETSALVKDRTGEERDAMAREYVGALFAKMPPLGAMPALNP